MIRIDVKRAGVRTANSLMVCTLAVDWPDRTIYCTAGLRDLGIREQKFAQTTVLHNQ